MVPAGGCSGVRGRGGRCSRVAGWLTLGLRAAKIEGSRRNAILLADVAQLVEQLICNQQVKGSSPFVSSGREAGDETRRLPVDGHPARQGGVVC